MRAVNVAFALAVTVIVANAAALAGTASVADAQNVRVIERRTTRSMRSDSLVERVFSAKLVEVQRMVADWREREAQLVRDLRAVPDTAFPARRRLEEQLALHTRDGFAMMSAIQVRCVDEDQGPRPAGYLGVNLTIEYAMVEREPKVLATRVTSIEPGSPAQKAGMQPDDRILSIGGLDARERFPDLSETLVPGRAIVVRVERAGATRDISVTVAPRPAGFGGSCDELERALLPMRTPAAGRILTEDVGPGGSRRIVVESRPNDARPDRDGEMRLMIFGPGAEKAFFAGAEFRVLDDGWREVLGVKEGVIVTEVASGSAAAQSGLRGGDVIVAVGRSPVTSPSGLVQLLGVMDPPQTSLSVIRGKEKKTLILRWGSR